VSRIAGIVSQLRVLSKPVHQSVETIRVEDALSVAVKTLTPGLTKDQRLTVCSSKSAHVTGNRNRLVQLFINILSNSLESFDDEVSDKAVVVTVAVNDAQVVIHFDDSGSGIPEHIRGDLFEPFVTGKYNGLGLGLVISKTIVDELQGSIEIQDRKPCGTRVTLTFDLALEPQIGSQSLAENLPERQIFSQRVLIVDDEPLVRSTLKNLLTDYEVVASTSAEEAQELIAEEKFDVVICDMVMPGVSGIDLLKYASHKDPQYLERFVLMSGGVPDPDVVDELKMRQVKFLSKPFRFEQLTELIFQLSRAG
jgi:CheY-like chemotaxis protein/two-component sensor histidine kinase